MQLRAKVLLDRLPDLVKSANPTIDLDAIRQSAMVVGVDKNKWDGDAYESFKKNAEKLRQQISQFANAHEGRTLLIGTRGVELEEFLGTDPGTFLDG